MKYKRSHFFVLALAALGLFAGNSSAALIGFQNGANFVVAGPGIADFSGLCGGAGCDSGFAGFNALLPDGLQVSGLVRQVIRDNGANSTSAFLQVTNIVATNTNVVGNVSDNFFIVSDQFSPSLNGLNAGVGIAGSYTNSINLIGGPVTFASTQAQMNYLTTGLITQAAFGGPLTGFSLTTPATFVTCLTCAGIGFFEAAFANNVPGGVEQLIGAINFTLGPQSTVVLPGSLIIEEGADNMILSEAPEPATFGLMGTALAAAAFLKRRRK